MAKSGSETEGSDAPRDPKLKRKEYDQALRKLQAELCRLQDWVKHKALRVIIVFEGRDAIDPRVADRRGECSRG